MAIASISASGHTEASVPEVVGDASTLVDRLRERADGAVVLVGFDFPIGVPQAYASRAGIPSFLSFLHEVTTGARASFFDVARTPDEISIDRPFYPYAPAGARQYHQLQALGVAAMDDLRRVCDRPTAGRRAAAPMFWLVGANQVGRAAIAGWREVLIPALRSDAEVALWPFDGPIEALLANQDVVIAETYPTEFYGHLDAHPDASAGGKRQQRGRQPACAAIISAAARLGVTLSATARTELDGAFDNEATGEDRFDAFVGLLGMLNILIGDHSPGPPAELADEAVAVEGWILGQGAFGAATLSTPLQRLASLLRERNAIDDEIAALIRRPALSGHIGEYIAAEVFDIDLERTATVAGHDGVFRSGPHAGATVNIKLYGKREGLLDIPARLPDYFLVLSGPRAPAASSVGGTRPLAIDEVFLFDAPALVLRLQDRGVKIGDATSLRLQDWKQAQIWPPSTEPPPLIVRPRQQDLLRLFAAASST